MPLSGRQGGGGGGGGGVVQMVAIAVCGAACGRRRRRCRSVWCGVYLCRGVRRRGARGPGRRYVQAFET